MAANPQLKPINFWCESAENWQLLSTSTIAIVIITLPVGWYSFYSPMDHGRLLPWVHWRCWLGGRKGIQPVKNWVSGTGMAICLKRSADMHMAQLMPLLLTVSCFSKIQIGFTILVPAHPGSPGQRAVKRVCVCVCATVLYWSMMIAA